MKLNISLFFVNQYFWIPLYISSLIPISSGGSLFEFIFLPFFIFYFFYRTLTNLEKLENNQFLIFLLSFLLILQSLIIYSISKEIRILQVSIRLIGMLITFYLSVDSLKSYLSISLIQNIKNYKKKLKNIFSFKIFPYFVLLLLVLSVFKAIQSSFFIGIDFPFYTKDAVNRQIFSPAIMLLSLYLFESYYKKNYLFKSQEISNFVLAIASLSSSILAVFSGSRSWVLVIMAFVFSKIINIVIKSKMIIKNNLFNKSILKKNIIIGSALSIVFSIFFFLIKNLFTIEKLVTIIDQFNTISILILNYSNDKSRGWTISDNLEAISNPLQSLFGNYPLYLNHDAASYTLINHFGYFVYIFIIFVIFSIPKQFFYKALPLTLTILFTILFGGLIFISPRLYLLWFAGLNFSIICNTNYLTFKK